MAEEQTNPIQTAPAQAAPEQAAAIQQAPAAQTAASGNSRQGSPLLVFLTVLLVLVGIVDVILWGVVGYYFLRDHQNGNRSEAFPNALVGGPLADTGEPSGGSAAGGDALAAYIQEITGAEEQERAVL